MSYPNQLSGFTVSKGTDNDVGALIELARLTEDLFGPMVERGFERVLRANVQRESLLVAKDKGTAHTVVGGLIFDEREAPIYHVSWLVVLQNYRRRGVGRLLLAQALTRAEPPCEIEVVTFSPDNLEGMAARHLYEAFGFHPGDMLACGPEGGSRQRYTLRLDA